MTKQLIPMRQCFFRLYKFEQTRKTINRESIDYQSLSYKNKITSLQMADAVAKINENAHVSDYSSVNACVCKITDKHVFGADSDA
jgi:hypothetical protein